MVLVREHPGLARALRRQTQAGTWTSVLSGVLLAPAAAGDVAMLAHAACRWNPDAIVVGAAAAKLSFWPALAVDKVELSVRLRQHSRFYLGSQRAIDPDDVISRDGLRFTCPALTAVDLCTELGGDAIDQLLRSRTATLAALWEVLRRYPNRRGNADRAKMLLDSRDEPWSAAERLFHRLLRAAGLAGWTANHQVSCFGRRYFIDVAFRGAKLAIEIDGRLHAAPEMFESDRARQADLVAAGWRVIRFTWAQLHHQPEWVIARIRQALAAE